MTHRTLDEYLKQTKHATAKQQATKPKCRIIGFYRETEFQDTPIGKIPKEWKIVSLADVAEYINGYPFKPSEWSDNGLPIVRIQNLNDPSKPFNYYNGPLSSKHKEVIINNEDLLFAWSASFGFYIWNRGRAILNQHIYKVKPKYSIIDKYFLYYVGNYYLNAYVKTHTVGSTMKHIRKSTLKSIRIPLPPLEEQWGVAEVLSTLDKAIEATERLIWRLERLKRGLMQELLTKGIGHREFKDTPIGKIPKEWQVVRLGEIVDIFDNMRVPLSERERANRKGPYPYCGANGIIDYIDGYIFEGEYVLLAEDGGYYGPFEKSAYIMNGKFWVNNHAHVLKAKEGIALNRFLMYMLNFLDLRPYLVGSTRTKLNQKEMKKIRLPLPPLEEQKRIVAILSTIDDWIELERKRREKLERLKHGLMELLLTGRVRVRVERVGEAGDSPDSAGVAGP